MADADLPIDIQTNKLLDWLISRRHCKKDYQKSVDTIRNKIRLAIQDMPQIDEVRELLQRNVFDYYVCQRIIEILKNTDKSSKNIFGQYTSKRFQDWQEICKIYEKDNVYLAEDAQTLIRNVNYEVPSLKKCQSKYEQQISDIERSIETSQKQSKNFLNEYNANCKKLAINGDNIRDELYSQLEILPEKMSILAEKIPSLISVCNYYKAFVHFVSQQSEIECLPNLHYLLAKGNTTWYEYRTGHIPDSIEEVKLGKSSLIADNREENVIDFGNDNNEIDFGDQIDFGDDDQASSTDTPSTGNGDFVKLDKEDLNVEIDEPIKVIDDEYSKHSEEQQLVKIAHGEDALSVLLHTEFRNKFINELIEIEYFLRERIDEMESDHALASYLFQSAPSVVQLTGIDGLHEMMTIVIQLREEFESPALKALYYMKNSPKYIENLYKKLNHLKILSEKATKKATDLEMKRSELLQELSGIGPQIQEQIQHTKHIQRRIEDAISKKYNNRMVNIMGGVQVL
ncbi:CDK5 regulatory subunit-associated protein 3 [Dermatophagoides farinae]|uniref:CDK5 regulatory subunit-associated protein 3 n=1 Tax=Dermatophagoides farinae TaxID=6954 RepID=UPI003F632C9B